MSAAGVVRAPAHRPASPSASVKASARWMPWALAALVGLLALPPRLVDTDRFVTTDEVLWMGRSGSFARALGSGQLGQTFQTGHPGVTTMWTALLGMGADRAEGLAGSRRAISRREVIENPEFLPGLADARRAFGFVTAAGVALAVMLAWGLFGPGPALLGGCLLALDPFFLAHARLVHLDATLATWVTLAVLGAVARWSPSSLGGAGGRAALALSGVATGLALLSKAPAVYLLGFIPLAAVALRGVGALRERLTWADLGVWGGLAALTYLALWPAMWTGPLETLGGVLAFIRDNASPGQPAAPDEQGAGPLFYPLVLLLRTTPMTVLGLILLAFIRPTGGAARAAVVLAAFCLGFALAMALAAKNFDRYLLPAFPVLDVLAGLGLWQAVVRMAPRHRTPTAAALAAAIIGLSSWWIAGAWPYVLTYGNPLVGGSALAQARITSAWGEGLDQVATYLNAQPNREWLLVGMPGEIYTTVLDAQLRGRVAPAEGADAAAYDYYVVYRRNVQRGERAPFFDERFLSWFPEATISLGGIPYAWVYDTAAGAPVGARFGDLIDLEGYGLDAETVRPGRRLEVRLRWRPRVELPAGLGVSLELRPGPAAAPDFTGAFPLRRGDPSDWSPGAGVDAAYPLSVAADAAPGEYVLAVRVLDAEGRPLPLTRTPMPGPETVAEPDAVALRAVQVR